MYKLHRLQTRIPNHQISLQNLTIRQNHPILMNLNYPRILNCFKIGSFTNLFLGPFSQLFIKTRQDFTVVISDPKIQVVSILLQLVTCCTFFFFKKLHLVIFLLQLLYCSYSIAVDLLQLIFCTSFWIAVCKIFIAVSWISIAVSRK